MRNEGETIKKNISKNIVKYREKAGLSQKELANLLKITPSRISNWEQGANCPTIDILFDVCKILNVSINDIYGIYPNEKVSLSYAEKEHLNKYRLIDEHGKSLVDMITDAEYERCTIVPEIPQEATRIINYYYRLASAGSGQIVFDMPPTESIEIPDIPEYKHVDYALGVNGHSMEPVFNDGDILLVQMTEEIELGEIGIFIVDGQSYVKKLGDRELISLNKGYDNIELTSDSKCVGRVITSLPPYQN